MAPKLRKRGIGKAPSKSKERRTPNAYPDAHPKPEPKPQQKPSPKSIRRQKTQLRNRRKMNGGKAPGSLSLVYVLSQKESHPMDPT